MAYILGFWYANGCICINRYTRDGCNHAYKKFSICNTDEQISYDISRIIGIEPCIVKPRENKHKCTYHINVNSDKFF